MNEEIKIFMIGGFFKRIRMKNFSGLVGIVLCLLLISPPVQARSPSDMVRSEFNEIVKTIGDTDYRRQENLKRLRQKLVKQVEPLFDFRKMTIQALGQHSRNLTNQQIDRLVTLFRELLKHLYVDRLTARLAQRQDQFSVDKLSLRIDGTKRRGNYALVNTVVSYEHRDEVKYFNLNYRMIKKQQRWRIYDVEISGMSLINNYRSQFNKILTDSSYEQLISTLEQKIEGL